MVYSVHGAVAEGEMTASLANMWRDGPDIGASYEQAIDRAMISNNVSTYLKGGRGGWNDPDMLQVGNIGKSSQNPASLFPDAEGRTQFALWCLLKAPLLIGTFLHNISEASLTTLTNKVAIAVNQDALGEQGILRKDGGYMPNKPRPTTNPAYGFQIWSGALSNGGAAAVLANLNGNGTQRITLTQSEMPTSRQTAGAWDIVEAFTGATRSGVALPATVAVGPVTQTTSLRTVLTTFHAVVLCLRRMVLGGSKPARRLANHHHAAFIPQHSSRTIPPPAFNSCMCSRGHTIGRVPEPPHPLPPLLLTCASIGGLLASCGNAGHTMSQCGC